MGNEINASDTKTLLVYRSPTSHPQSTPSTLERTALKTSAHQVIFGVLSDARMTFTKHRRSVSRAAAQRFGILRKSWQVFHDRSLCQRSFRSFVQQVLEYCSAVLCSAADSHVKLLDRVVRNANFLAAGVIECNLPHRRSAAVLCMFFEFKSNPMHPLSHALILSYVLARVTQAALVAHWHSFVPPCCRTS